MAILKLNKSKTSVTFYDDFGNAYPCSNQFIQWLLSGTMKMPFIQLNRLPMGTSQERFEMSPVLGKGWEAIPPSDPRWTAPACSHTGAGSADALTPAQTQKREQASHFEDKVVW